MEETERASKEVVVAELR